MKQAIAIVLSLTMLLALAACGASNEPASQTAAPTEAAQATSKPAEASASEQEAPDTVDVAEIVEQVRAMQGQPVQDLIDWLGEPLSRDYSSSCLVDGGQDGQLDYDGFTVYTLVEPDGTETIYDAE